EHHHRDDTCLNCEPPDALGCKARTRCDRHRIDNSGGGNVVLGFVFFTLKDLEGIRDGFSSRVESDLRNSCDNLAAGMTNDDVEFVDAQSVRSAHSASASSTPACNAGALCVLLKTHFRLE